jgi:hypothetical protein
MPLNRWLAIDATTSLEKRARELRQAWEQFLDDETFKGVRAPIADSWRRSHAAGVDPSGKRLAPVVADADEASARWDVHPLAAAVPLVRDFLAAIPDELIVVSDATGLLLWIEGEAKLRLAAADEMNFAEGALWSEGGAGTNAIGTALAADHAVQVFATEHFNEVVQAWTCAAAPINDPDTGQLLGIIDLTGRMMTAHPYSFAVAVAAAEAVEAHLLCDLQEEDARLRSRYQGKIAAGRGRRAIVRSTGRVVADHPEGWLQAARLLVPAGGGELILPSGAHAFAEPLGGHEEAFLVRTLDRARRGRPHPLLKLSLLGRDRAGVEVAGGPVQLSHRLTEILALLAMRPDGMTSEELAADLYGDPGRPSTVRVEVYRLRKLLGPWIDTELYRITIDVDFDVAHIQGLLDRGAVREAAERYGGPLLPHSDAPGIVRERDALDGWLRKAVMTADDVEALWAWAQSPSGRVDLTAWTRLLRNLNFRDPRRSLAATQVGALRDKYA